MKRTLTTLLFATLSLSATAAENYGGMTFHSSVHEDMKRMMKKDLRFLFLNQAGPVDREFSEVMSKRSDGPAMHNWLINRMKFVFDENFGSAPGDYYVDGKHTFPKTPKQFAYNRPEQPTVIGKAIPGRPGVKLVRVMENFGTYSYRDAKRQGVLMGFNVDGVKVPVISPRAGLVRIGEGLFRGEREVDAV